MKKCQRKRCASTGRVNAVLMVVMGSIGVVCLLVAASLALRPDARRQNTDQQIVRVYCAAGIAKPVEQVVEKYNAEFNANVQVVRTGGSGELAGLIATEHRAQVADGADLYLTADDLLLEKAFQNGVVAERISLAIQQPVIAVRNDSSIAELDLVTLIQSTNMEFGIASDRAAVGKMVRHLAKAKGLQAELEQNRKTDSENVMVLAQALATGSLDAAVIWDTTVEQLNRQNDQPVLRIAGYADSEKKTMSRIAIGVLSRSKHPTAALRFARYLASPEKGSPSFRSFGFGVVKGDRWEEVPEIHLYCGSMFTPVLEEEVRKFAEREGVNIYPRWEGCGALTSSILAMKDPELFPDAYLACDKKFLDDVQAFFEPAVTVSTNDIVIAVAKSRMNEIRNVEDIVNGNYRVGICDPDKSALGFLTRRMLTRQPFQGTYPKLNSKASVVVDVGPTLVSQLSAGGLDVAFVYRTNVLADASNLSRISIVEIDDQGAETAHATQPWAISRTTANRQLMGRLFEKIVAVSGQENFTEAGFSRPPIRREPKQ